MTVTRATPGADTAESEIQYAPEATLPEPAIGLLTRRNMIAAGALGIAGAALAACSSGSTSSPPSTTAPSSAAPAPNAPGKVITTVAEVPVGGAFITATGQSEDGFLVAQESPGNFSCHSNVCTHEGCKINRIVGTEAVCPCHGSRFNIFSGAVEEGPATRDLTAVPVTVSSGNVVAS